MKFLTIALIVVAVIIILAVIKRMSRRNTNVFDRGSSIARKFKDCCARGVKKMFGGGA